MKASRSQCAIVVLGAAVNWRAANVPNFSGAGRHHAGRRQHRPSGIRGPGFHARFAQDGEPVAGVLLVKY